MRNANYLRLHTERDAQRGYIRAVESSPHLRIHTSGGEDIGFYDGGTLNVHFEGSNGHVGIGTSSPQARLHVNGALKIGSQNTCNATYAGTMRWNAGKKHFEGCNGSKWVAFGREQSTPIFPDIRGYWKFEGNYNDSSGR